MAQWIKTDRDISLYVNLDHILYLIVFKNLPAEEGEINYHVRAALVSAPKEEIILKVCNTENEANDYIAKLVTEKKGKK